MRRKHRPKRLKAARKVKEQHRQTILKTHKMEQLQERTIDWKTRQGKRRKK
jgi:hypothetical protein